MHGHNGCLQEQESSRDANIHRLKRDLLRCQSIEKLAPKKNPNYFAMLPWIVQPTRNNQKQDKIFSVGIQLFCEWCPFFKVIWQKNEIWKRRRTWKWKWKDFQELFSWRQRKFLRLFVAVVAAQVAGSRPLPGWRQMFLGQHLHGLHFHVPEPHRWLEHS